MTAAHSELWSRIDAFAVDGPDPVALPFAARLAREHGWTRDYAETVVREYKRFVFLAMTAGSPVCPSEDVDAAWHLHLTYTRSYWTRFCGEVLGKPLHHDPTRGGAKEQNKHLQMYAFTFEAYRKAFGKEPPADVWPDAESRFGDDAKQRMVNTARNWVVPKPVVRRAAAVAATAATVLLFATGCVGGFNPFELVGAQYLLFLIPLLVVATIIGIFLRKFLVRTSGTGDVDPATLDWQSVAVLAGGQQRLLTAAVARLAERGALVVSEDGKKLTSTGNKPGHLTPAESLVAQSLPLDHDDKKAMKSLGAAIAQSAKATEARLRDDGLLFTPGQAKAICFKSALPYLLVFFGLGVSRLVIGFFNRKPLWFLVIVLFLGLIPLFGLLFARPRVTRRGNQELDRLRSQPAPDGQAADIALLVALGGTAVLAGTPYADLQVWYPRQTTASSSGCSTGCNSSGSGCSSGGGGCSSGGGGGDSGGSGCGGCGGGGCGGGGD